MWWVRPRLGKMSVGQAGAAGDHAVTAAQEYTYQGYGDVSTALMASRYIPNSRANSAA